MIPAVPEKHKAWVWWSIRGLEIVTAICIILNFWLTHADKFM